MKSHYKVAEVDLGDGYYWYVVHTENGVERYLRKDLKFYPTAGDGGLWKTRAEANKALEDYYSKTNLFMTQVAQHIPNGIYSCTVTYAVGGALFVEKDSSAEIEESDGNLYYRLNDAHHPDGYIDKLILKASLQSDGGLDILLDIPLEAKENDFYYVDTWNFLTKSKNALRRFLCDKWATLKGVKVKILMETP